MDDEILTVGFLSYTPDIYEFLHNFSCQISETLMFTEVCPILVKDTVCYLIYRKIDVSKFEAYTAIDSILNNNILNFIDRYGVDFQIWYQDDLLLLHAELINDYFFTFVVNRGIKTSGIGVLKNYMGKTVDFKYVIIPSSMSVYSDGQTSYNRVDSFF